MIGDNNSFGITGVTTGARLRLVNAYNRERGWDIATALAIASYITKPGDVVLIEQQTYGPSGDYVPVEWDTAVYDAITTLTKAGRSVVEPAANGGQNLSDTSRYGSPFPSGKPDSGAIIVGAGEACSSPLRTRLGFSDYGTRVNVQGPGDCVATTGYGDLYASPGVNAYYTRYFNGTSSASPVVAAAAASVSSAYQTLNGKSATPSQVRAFLVQTGSAQDTTSHQGHIGPLPNLAGALPKTDLTPPSAATNLTARLNANKQVVLTWTASGDNVKVSSYRVYRSGWWVYGSVNAPMTTFTDTSVTTGNTYTCTIKAVDSAGRVSAGTSVTVAVT